jgi:dTDP-glucose 4,6-dehydratase
MTILVTGAAGFIGSNFVLDWFSQSTEDVVSLDLLTYAGNLENLSSLNNNPHHHFVQGNIGNSDLILNLLKEYKVRAVINFAAESHVDRSIQNASNFVQTNIVATHQFLETIRLYWGNLDLHIKKTFRFVHVSTDEVYGSLEPLAEPLTEECVYKPNNPYSATKAASDHLVRAWHQTYNLPVITIHLSNNFGPYHFPEKLIPLTILNALNGKPLTIYGDGKQIRDWLYVKDSCKGIDMVLKKGVLGEVYNMGGSNEKTNYEVVTHICSMLDEIKPRKDGKSYSKQIAFIQDRPGHDRRYAIDSSKIKKDLGWQAGESFSSGLRKTIIWFIENYKIA